MIRFLPILLLLAGCAKRSTNPPDHKPTAFLEWCATEQFGVKSGDATSSRQLGGGEVGVYKFRGYTPSQTAAEAQKFLHATGDELRRRATQHGCSVLELHAIDLPPDRLLIKYHAGPLLGVLEGKSELSEVDLGGKKTPAYYIVLKLTETVRDSEP